MAPAAWTGQFPQQSELGQLRSAHPTSKFTVAAAGLVPAAFGGLFITLGVLGLAGVSFWGDDMKGSAGALRVLGFGLVLCAISAFWVWRRLRKHGNGWAVYQRGLMYADHAALYPMPFDAIELQATRVTSQSTGMVGISILVKLKQGGSREIAAAYVRDVDKMAEVLGL